MKKASFILIFLFLVSGFLQNISAADGIYWKVTNFDADIYINEDSSLSVAEEIKFDFGQESGHGIYRYIPYQYVDLGDDEKRGTSDDDIFNLNIKNISVVDEYGDSYNYEKSRTNGYVELKIGDADYTITGEHTYLISYKVECSYNTIGSEKVKCPVRVFGDFAEVYWNVTGNDWDQPITKAQATVWLPYEASRDDIRADCYSGTYGAEDKCSYISEVGQNTDFISFSETDLEEGEGLTLVFQFPEDFIKTPTAFSLFVKKFWPVPIPIFVFFLMFWLWSKKGKDPKGRGTIVAQFDPPDKLSPAEVGTIMDNHASNKDISSEIVYLATKGFIKINRLEKKIFGKADYRLDKLKDPDNSLNEFQKLLMDDLFKGRPEIKKLIFSKKKLDKMKEDAAKVKKESVKLSDLKEKFYEDLSEINKRVYESVVYKGYFLKNPKTVIAIYIGIGVAVGIAGGFLGIVFGLIFTFCGVLSGLIIIAFGIFMPKPTKKGALAKEHTLGLKEYLRVAEKERIKFHNAPEKNPQEFEKLLPYAMILGVEKQWAKQFEGIYTQNPSWYSDPTGARFSAVYFAGSLHSFSSTATTTMASAPSSGGGAGGGGFSGGGFGGGGGGGW